MTTSIKVAQHAARLSTHTTPHDKLTPTIVARSKYFNLTEMARVHHVSGGKPMLIADMGFAFPHSGYDKQEWHLYDSQEQAGAAYRDFVVGSAKSEFIVGLNKCQIVGAWSRTQARHARLRPDATPTVCEPRAGRESLRSKS